MKGIVFIIFGSLLALMLHAAAVSCSRQETGSGALQSAELAYANSHYDAAQSLCDKLVNDQEFFSSLNTDELCRLALLFVRLAENYGDENANTAFASKTLDAAIERNADSTALFLARAPMEDRARLSLISAISESRRNPVSVDSLEYDPSDSIIIY
ncbi:MAG: hypothetical protein OSJ37_00825 [Muribaculaceae bacterium]|nr:hypothetical protein [Muribaculaceae bacterium]